MTARPGETEDVGVWCRVCGATTFATVRTDRFLEGDVRVHRCDGCGHEFGSLATFLDRAATARSKWTPLPKPNLQARPTEPHKP